MTNFKAMTKFNQFLLATASCCLVNLASAGVNQWTTSVAPGAGSTVSALAINPVVPSTYYAAIGEKVYFSVNAGSTWASLSTYFDNTFNRTVAALAVDPVTPSRIYAGTSGGLLISQDGGVNWLQNNLAPTITGATIAGATLTNATVTNAAIVGGNLTGTITFATIAGGYVSGSISGGTVSNAWVTGGNMAGTISAGGLTVGTLDSTTGTITGGTIANASISAATVETPVIRDIIANVSPPTAFLNPSLTALAITQSYPSAIFAGSSGGGVYLSTDTGHSWTLKNTGLTNLNVTSLAIDATTAGTLATTTLYAGTTGGIFKSNNGGANWSAINTGLGSNPRITALAINPVTPATLYAATSGSGIYQSTDGGGSWVAVNTGLTALDVKAIAIDPVAPATLYAGTAGHGVFRSTNGGASWIEFNAGLSNKFATSLIIAPLTAEKIFAGTDGGVFEYEIGSSGTGSQVMGATRTATGTLDKFSLTSSLTVGQNDIGQAGNVYIALQAFNNLYFYDGLSWILYHSGPFPPYLSGSLAGQYQNISIVADQNLYGLNGANFYIGYGLNDNDMLNNQKYWLIYTVR